MVNGKQLPVHMSSEEYRTTIGMPTEDQDQDFLIHQLSIMRNQNKIYNFTHISNESTYDKGKGKKGVAKGVPDLLIVTKKRVIYIELKRLKGGIIDEDQKWWNQILNAVDPGCAKICKGQDEALQFINENM